MHHDRPYFAISHGGLPALLQNRNLDTAIHLAAAHGCATLGTLLNPASVEAASASISARALFQPLSLLWSRQRLIEWFQRRVQSVRLTLAKIRTSPEIRTDHFQAVSPRLV